MLNSILLVLVVLLLVALIIVAIKAKKKEAYDDEIMISEIRAIVVESVMIANRKRGI